jgi:hypothetical protein
MGFPADRPFAFFCGAAGVLSNPRREMDLVRRWVASLRDSQDPLLRELPVIIRPPVHASRWRALDFTDAGPVAFGPRRYEASGEIDRVLLAESVRYAAVVVGIDAHTLAMAAAMGKRGIAISRADAGSADETPIEFLWTTPGSSVSYAASLDDLNRQLRASLTPSSLAVALRSPPRWPCSTTAAVHLIVPRTVSSVSPVRRRAVCARGSGSALSRHAYRCCSPQASSASPDACSSGAVVEAADTSRIRSTRCLRT